MIRYKPSIASVLITAIALIAIARPQPQTLPPGASFIIGPQLPIGSTWYDMTQVTRGRFHADNFPATPPAIYSDSYIMTYYYGLGANLYALYARTNDPADLARARKVVDSWWQNSWWIGSGTVRQWPDSVSPPPRHGDIAGLVLRALDGRPEMWDWINSYTRFSLDHWCKKRIGSTSLFYGVREGAFALDGAVILSQVLPDSFPLQSGGMVTNGTELRAQYLADAEAVATQYYGALQQADGSWRWDDPDYVDSDGGFLRGVMQPFMVGLLLNALVDVHRASTNDTVKANIQNQIVKACHHLYSDGPYMTQLVPSLNVKRRGFAYFYHGGTTVNPTKYENGDYSANWDTTNPSDVQNMREAIALIIAPYGYAYMLTKDPYFLAAGDEMWDSAYGETDKIRDYFAGDAKSYNQNTRSAARYLVWRGASVSVPSPQPTIVPSPSPSVTPTPTPAPSATPTPLPSPSPSPSPSATPTPSPSGKRCRAWPPWKIIYCL